MKAEIEISNGYLFLSVDANISPEEEKELRRDGWNLLNNGIALEDGTPAFYYSKKIN